MIRMISTTIFIAFTNPDGGVHEFHLENMEQPLDMFYSIAFERFEPDSNPARTHQPSSISTYISKIKLDP